ncbi:hypothetical protein [Paenibacillus polymyxa]|uniref:hypothetical protein n=1 Tax=Paenibacillus polymyxa TaxID=1406 RepID=UPI00129B9F83|nr:hypothetical protein [Paenibacillus polymyxa]KAE8558963.1 hypothetical protein BJH92_16900 [Paenibacillus polymyxa]MCJ1220366.1 hypothetical protein [Paenibacillus polymyxa]
MEIVINRCFGGFGLSTAAFHKLIELGWRVTVYTEDVEYADPTAELVDTRSLDHNDSFFPPYSFIGDRDDKEIRTNKDVIAVVKALGDKANGPCAELKIVEVPDDIEWIITDYDGLETVAEEHRVWS